MKNESVHRKLGAFMEDMLKLENVNISRMCHEIHMGPATYQKVKKGTKNI